MPVIVFHGTADARVDPVNADQVIAQWTKTNACLAAEYGDISFVVTQQVIDGAIPGGHAFKKHVYLEAGARPLMEKWLVDGLGHAWSGSPEQSKYGDPNGPNASAEIWRFFCEATSPSCSPQGADSSLQKSSETTK